MKRVKWLYAVDALAFACFAMLSTTGFLIHYILPPGSGRLEGYGSSKRKVDMIWGLMRHEWGSIHFWLGIAFITLILVHLLLHRAWLAKKMGAAGRGRSKARLAVTLLCLLLLLAAALAPLFSPRQTLTRAEIRAARDPEVASPSPERPRRHQHQHTKSID